VSHEKCVDGHFISVEAKMASLRDMPVMRGSCHCGQITFRFASNIRPEEFTPRACDCSFCQRHGATFISDQNGSLELNIKQADALGEYRFGHNLAKFLFCRHCGVFVAALFETGDRIFGSVNTRCMGDVKFGDFQIVSPQKLDAEQKKERWARVMIPDVTVGVSGT
jgi:hypothetical protein